MYFTVSFFAIVAVLSQPVFASLKEEEGLEKVNHSTNSNIVRLLEIITIYDKLRG
jgi:hypothetical protein